MPAVGKVSPNLEDYIEVIYELIRESGVARVNDVAKRKSISKASVNNALKRLVKEGLIFHKAYATITLTDKGTALAKKLEKRHAVISLFLQDILQVKPEVADVDACAIEHHVHKETIDGLMKYSRAISHGLNTIPPGQKCRIKKINATGTIKQRLLEMGLHVGEIVKVERIAPLGDPIDIKVKRFICHSEKKMQRRLRLRK